MEKVFSALADKNRRKVIELLHKQESTLLELHESFSDDMSFQALSKHIEKLQKADIITKRKQGKYRILSLNRKSLKEPLEWISYYSNFWNESFDKLDMLIKQQNANGDDE